MVSLLTKTHSLPADAVKTHMQLVEQDQRKATGTAVSNLTNVNVQHRFSDFIPAVRG